MVRPISLAAFALATSLLRIGCSSGAGPSSDAGDATTTNDTSSDGAYEFEVFSPPPAGPYEAAPPSLRRLTQRQYTNALHDVLGDAVVVPRALEPDTRSEGSSSVASSETSISLRGTEQYQSAAYDVAEQVLRNPMRRAPLLGCSPTTARDDACAERFVRAVGRRLWRRPLEAEEVARLVDLSGRAGTALNDFYKGLEYGLAALLQAPDFVFRAELGTPQGTGRRYERYEFAARLSFFLWDGPPDDALLDAAERNELDGPALERTVDRMIADPRARRGFEAFLNDWLTLDKLDELTRDAVLFPSFAADFGPSAREEVLRTAALIAFERDGDFRDLLTTRDTFVNRRLAALYGVPFPVRDAPATQFVQVELPETLRRRGLLGTAAFLAMQAHPVSSSATLRGKWVRELLLCELAIAPPVDVNTMIPEPSTTHRTLRERMLLHQDVDSCRGCHRLLDSVGLGFENFDAIGRFRASENDATIDPSGVLDAVPFRDAYEFAGVLREHPSFPTCVTDRLYRHAWGQLPGDSQRAEVERLTTGFTASGFRFRALLRSIALSDRFRTTAALTIPPPETAPDAGVDAARDATLDANSDATNDASSTDATTTEGGR